MSLPLYSQGYPNLLCSLFSSKSKDGGRDKREGNTASFDEAWDAEDGSKGIVTRKQFKAMKADPKLLHNIASRGLGQTKSVRRFRKEKGGRADQIHSALELAYEAGQQGMFLKLFGNKFVQIESALTADQFPKEGLPEVAFAGRSNVGKSSLLRALAIRSPSIRIEDRPGTTQSLSFFNMGRFLRFVDMPGYGFAYAPKERVDGWINLMSEYLTTRRSLKRVLVLVDGRRGLMQSDMDFFSLLDRCEVRFQVIITKADQVPQVDLAKRTQIIRDSIRGFKHAVPQTLIVSSKFRQGISELWKELTSLVEPAKVERIKELCVRQVARSQKQESRDLERNRPPTPPAATGEQAKRGDLSGVCGINAWQKRQLNRKDGGSGSMGSSKKISDRRRLRFRVHKKESEKKKAKRLEKAHGSTRF